jgi:hypothetical protein
MRAVVGLELVESLELVGDLWGGAGAQLLNLVGGSKLSRKEVGDRQNAPCTARRIVVRCPGGSNEPPAPPISRAM